MNRFEIDTYATHYEINGYVMNACMELEYALSTYDEIYFRRDYYTHYDEENEILYVPRGVDADFIEQKTGCPVPRKNQPSNEYKKISFSMTLPPRDDVQKEAIRFLLGKGEHSYTANASQLVLALIGGGGKTYASVAAMSIIGVKTLVVCHTDDLRQQWHDRIMKYTNLPSDAIVLFKTSKHLMQYKDISSAATRRLMSNQAVYVVTHSLVASFMKKYGFEAFNDICKNLGIGLKIVDEFHLNFLNTLKLDYATNINKTFYLSATPGRSDKNDNRVFQTSFHNVYKLKREIENSNNTMIAIFDVYKSSLSDVEIAQMYARKMFSIHKYTDVVMRDGFVMTKVIQWVDWLFDGRADKNHMVMVLSSTIKSNDLMAKVISNAFPDLKVTAYHSDNKIPNVEDYNVVCATIAMVGTGNDYSNLKAIINTEPYRSPVTSDQLPHRLMRGNVGLGTTYYIDCVDRKIPQTMRMASIRRDIISTFASKVVTIDPYVKKRG